MCTVSRGIGYGADPSSCGAPPLYARSGLPSWQPRALAALRNTCRVPSRPGGYAGRDRGRDLGSLREFRIAIGDRVAPGDLGEGGIGNPDLAFLILDDEHAHRPVETGVGVRGQEADSQW